MAVTATRLAGPMQPGTTTAIILAAGTSGHTYILTQVIVTNTTASPATLIMGVGGTTAATSFIYSQSFPANSITTVDLKLPLVGGTDTINALQGTAAALTVTLSGLDVL